MQLLPNEHVLTSFNDSRNTNYLWVSNHRVEMSSNSAGNSTQAIIFLENISSIESRFRSYPVYMVIAILTAICAILMILLNHKTEGVLVLGAALFFWILWLLTKKHLISVSSNGGVRVDFIVHGENSEKVNEFIAVVCLAKEQRLKQPPSSEKHF